MIKFFTQHLCVALVGAAILSSCSRPVAYFQRSSVDPSAKTQTIAATAPTPTLAAEPNETEALAQATTTMTQLEGYVRNDNQLASNKKLTARMSRVKALLTSTHGTLAPKTANTSQKMSLMERLMLKKINKKINRQLAPAHITNTTINPVILIGGIVLLIGGLILLIAGTGTAAFIGLIIALIGALGTVLGLFGQ
ncbi:hypothetical protein [Spirosoma litoris]